MCTCWEGVFFLVRRFLGWFRESEPKVEYFTQWYNPFQLHLELFSKGRNRQVVTKQMLLNSKCFDKLVLHNECGVRFAVSLFALTMFEVS